MPHLFEPLQLRDVVLANRIAVSPMCQYSAYDGMPTDWHLVHLGSRAVGGAGLVIVEATAVTREGRISPSDLGLWDDSHAEAFALITRFVRMQGSAVGIQLAHAGRKASTKRPWEGNGVVHKDDGGWEVVGPTGEAFSPDYPEPRALDEAAIDGVVRAFRDAALRAQDAGFNVLEVHAAHGYLIHQFLSPLVNRRTRPLRRDVREPHPLVPRGRERRAGGLAGTPAAVCCGCRRPTGLKGAGTSSSPSISRGGVAPLGVDLIDCSSGGAVAHAKVPVGPGYQVPFAAEIKAAGIATGAVGLITSAAQADQIVRTRQADCVLLAREVLRDPYWPLHAARELGHAVPWPAPYLRAAPHGTPAR